MATGERVYIDSNGMAVVDHIKRLPELVRADGIQLLDKDGEAGTAWTDGRSNDVSWCWERVGYKEACRY